MTEFVAAKLVGPLRDSLAPIIDPDNATPEQLLQLQGDLGIIAVEKSVLFSQAAAWWDASSLSYLADGAAIQVVNDITGNGNSLYYSAAAAPALTKATDATTGKAVMRGDGTQTLVATPIGSGEPSPGGLSPSVTFVTAIRPSITQISAGPGLCRAGVTFDARFDNNLFPGGVIVSSNSLSNTGRLYNPSLFDGKGHVVVFVVTTAVTNVYVDGYFQSTIAGNLLGDGLFTQPIISRFLIGDTMCAGAWNRRLSQDEVYEITSSINDDWSLGLPLGGNGADGNSAATVGTTTDGSAIRIYTPSQPSEQPVLVLWSHPHTHSVSIDNTYFAYPILRAMAARGWHVAMSNEGYAGSPGGSGSNWGNATSQIALRQLYDLMVARIGSTPKVVLIGGSMGGLVQANAVQKNTLPAGVVVASVNIDAVLDLYAMYRNTDTYSTAIDTGYSIVSSTLQSASAVGSIISSGVSYAAGTILSIDPIGTNPELKTVQSVTGSGPYTITLTTPLAFAHASGVKISDYGTKTASFDPMLASVANFAGTSLLFIASPGDTVVSESLHTDPFRARVVPIAKEATIIQHEKGHLHASTSNPRDIIAFVDRAIA